MRNIIDTMDELGLAIAPSNRKYVAMVDQEPPINTGETFPIKYLEALQALWADEMVQNCYRNSASTYAMQEVSLAASLLELQKSIKADGRH